MAEPLIHNTIDLIARAVMAQLSAPDAVTTEGITGLRSSGSVTVANPTGSAIVLRRNTYMVPIVKGRVREKLLFKVAANPLTLDQNGITGGDWTIPATGSLAVGLASNVGGIRHNVDADTVFQFDPPLTTGLTQTAEAVAAFAGGTESAKGLVQQISFFEELASDEAQRDFFSAKLGNFPALMLTWLNTTPVEGRTSGARQGASRVRRQGRVMRESFALYVVTGRVQSDDKRRSEGLTILEAATRLLTDRMCNNDGEILSAFGAGLEVVSRGRLLRGPKSYVYSMQFRVARSFQPIDTRTYNQWLTLSLRQALPGIAGQVPPADDPLTVVDVREPMT